MAERTEVPAADERSQARRRLLVNNLVGATAVGLSALPITGPMFVIPWLAAACALSWFHARGGPRTSATMAVLSGFNHSLAALALWSAALPVGRLLGAVIVMMTLFWLVMQYHARPRVFFAAAAPGIALIVAASIDVAGMTLRTPYPWLALTALGAPALVIHYALGARSYFARSQAALKRARAEAEERAVEAGAAARAKRFFIDTVGHEIRTPLNGVLGMMQAMEADRLSAAQRTRLQAAREAGEALSVILQDVVELAAIETGRFKLRDGEFDLAQVVEAACAGAAVEAQAKPLRLLVDLEPDSLGTYRGDAKRIRQALAKLLDNAVRFTAAGEVVLTGRADPDGALRLTVRDTGQGIPARKLQQLFEPFELADASRTRRHGGAGLGLAIAREFARAMGGEIEVVSQVGQGSAFTLRLPLLRLAAPAPAPPARVRQEAPDLSRVRLLAAEDNPMNQLVLKTLLGQHGLDPVLVDNGAEAVAAWRQGGFDVILMDVQMPELDGAAATRAIRAEEAARGLPRTPIIALTANAMPYQIEEYRQAGMDAHVAKPVEAGLLHDAIVEALKRPAQEAAAAA